MLSELGERPAPEVKEPINEKLRELGNVRVAGRLATPPRTMGKAAFEFAENADGDDLAALDPLLPKPTQYKQFVQALEKDQDVRKR